jgi:hypothetical protein
MSSLVMPVLLRPPAPLMLRLQTPWAEFFLRHRRDHMTLTTEHRLPARLVHVQLGRIGGMKVPSTEQAIGVVMVRED